MVILSRTVMALRSLSASCPRLLGVALLCCASCVARPAAGEIRIGIVGCDTSHAVAFTKLINDPTAEGELAECQVVAAYPGGSPDIPSSRDRVERFTKELEAMEIAIVPAIDDLPDRCDAFLLESVDGRVHLDQFRSIAVGKPVFIDKPAASSLAEMLAIFEIADQTETPCFSSSALRYCTAVQKLQAPAVVGDLLGASTSSPYHIEPHHPDLFWYAIHGVESLFALLGSGCQQVAMTETESAGVVVGTWSDGRVGVFRGLKQGPSNQAAYTFTAFGTRGIEQSQGFGGYLPLVVEIGRFFSSGTPPVTEQETIEIFALMEAAEASKGQAGRPVAIAETVERARRESKSILNP